MENKSLIAMRLQEIERGTRKKKRLKTIPRKQR
jgi:hypothetical protein